MIPVSVLVQTKNEEAGIRHCLEGLTAFDEVIVVDSNSDDNTVAIARSMGAEVINFQWNGQYPKKKQWQLENVATRHPWILFLDADEAPTMRLLQQLPLLTTGEQNEDVGAVDLQLIYSFDGRPLQHGHRVVKRALLKRSHAVFPEVPDLDAPGMGELEGHYQPVVRGKVLKLADALLHDDQDPVHTWFDRHNRYSDWEAYLRTHRRARLAVARLRSRQGQLFSKVPGKTVLFFIYAFIYRRGFLDGIPGLNYAVAQSFYYWQIALKVRERHRRAASVPNVGKQL